MTGSKPPFAAPEQQVEETAEHLVYPQPQQSDASAKLPEAAPTLNSSKVLSSPITIVGGGPVGMILALLLSRIHGQKCILVEQALETTKYPKMEYTNPRSMEIYRQLGLVSKLRAAGIPEHFDMEEVFCTGVSPQGMPLQGHSHESHSEWLERSKKCNDGTQGPEGILRCTQDIVEPLLKEEVLRDENITTLFGHRFLGLQETSSEVTVEVIDIRSGELLKIKSLYVAGTDGAGSLVRHVIGVQAVRRSLGPEMISVFAHFRSSDPTIRRFGRFWHLNTMGVGVIIDQNEEDIFTTHMVLPPNTGLEVAEALLRDPQKIINDTFGGIAGPCHISVDEFICTGLWKIAVALADKFESTGGRVFLAGDAAHQFSPVGGHGLNTGIGDAHDLAWKLSASLQGFAGPHLLRSYDAERRAVASENLTMVEKAMGDFVMPLLTGAHKYGIDKLNADSQEGQEARTSLGAEISIAKWVHEQHGMTLGQRYKSSPILYRSDQDREPERIMTQYTPSTWPGGRIPHVWLRDGTTSTLDLIAGSAYNIIDFSESGQLAAAFARAGQSLRVPIKTIHIPQETHAKQIFGRDAVLVRPDGFSCWTLQHGQVSLEDRTAIEILNRVIGY